MSRNFKNLFVISLLVVSFMFCNSAFAFSNHVIWSFKAETGISSGISANNNYVFAGDASGNLYALNANTGRLMWSYSGMSSVVGTPSIVNDSVIFVQNDGVITCLNISDGSVLWQNRTSEDSSGMDSAPDGTAAGDGKIFVSKGDGVLYALNASNGRVVWTYKSDIELRSAPAYGENLVFLGEYNGVFSILNQKSGERIGGGGAGGAINTLNIKNGNAYASSWDGSVQSFKVKDIIPLWNVKVGDPVTTPPEVNDSKIAVGTARGLIFALDEKTGNILWRFESNSGNISAKPVIAEGFVFVSTSNGVYALDSNSGRERSKILPNEGGSDSSPEFKNGTLYLGFSNGAVYAVK